VHELGITQGIIDRARDAAVERDAKRITDVYILMTPAADFTEDSIIMYFEMLTQDDDLFLDAALHVEHRPVSALCMDCSHEFSANAPQPACPQCGSLTVRLDPEAPMIQLTDIVIDED
jgi:Zn finger protein HypA/HybF involved in hydrogenase expression